MIVTSMRVLPWNICCDPSSYQNSNRYHICDPHSSHRRVPLQKVWFPLIFSTPKKGSYQTKHGELFYIFSLYRFPVCLLLLVKNDERAVIGRDYRFDWSIAETFHRFLSIINSDGKRYYQDSVSDFVRNTQINAWSQPNTTIHNSDIGVENSGTNCFHLVIYRFTV